MALSLTLPGTLSIAHLLTKTRVLASASALPMILLLALGLRLYGIDWDQGHLFHPDERAILMKVNDLSLPPASDMDLLLDADESPWNPRWFPYGSFPLYLLKGVQLAVAPGLQMDLYDLRLAGRAISALADLATVLVVYLLAQRLADRRTALLATMLTALAVLHIQLSHFYAVDTLLTLFVLLSVYSLVHVVQEGGYRWWALSGVSVALALATKSTAASLLFPLVVAFLLSMWRDGRGIVDQWARWRRPVRGLALALSVGALVLFIAQPYALLDWGRFWADVTEQGEMVRRVRDYPFTRQYADTLPYFYQLRQLILFGLGLPLGLVVWAGLVFVLGRATLRRSPGDLLVLAWVIPYLLIIGAFPVKFLRYLLPVTPLLLIFSAQMLVAALEWTRQNRQALAPWARGAVALVVVFTALYALAYLNIYTKPHPAVRASAWLQEHAPPGATLLREHWEEGLPELWDYPVAELPLYDPDRPAKTELIASRLAESDYLLFYSSRLYGTIPRLAQRYPDSNRYYQLLFQGDLGYRLVHFETAYPSLPGIAFTNSTFGRPGLLAPDSLTQYRPAPLTINLGYADESFVVYDHPKVLIFQNTERLSSAILRRRLAGEETARAPPDQPSLLVVSAESGIRLVAFDPGEETADRDPMLMPVDEWEAQQKGGTWQEIMPADGLGARFPLLSWLVAIYVISLVTLPLALRLFRSLPDRGYLLARPLGLLLLAYVPWLLASLKWISFSRNSILLGLLLLLTLGAWVTIRHRTELGEFLRARWRLLVFGEVLFLGAFLAFVLVRMANPDLWHPSLGGEKPLDLAYLNAVVRSSFMPPYDPWFAGGSMNYYYFGQFLVATLVKLTGVPTMVAFNLAVPLFFALTVGAAFSVAYNLAEGARRNLARERAQLVPSWSPLVAGLGAALLLPVLGNLDGAVQLFQGAWVSLTQGDGFPAFDFWRSSRMMPPDPPGFEITEFPFFTFLYGDLHAHLLALPMTLLVLGIALNTALAAAGHERRGIFLTSLGALALAVGSLWAINAWDYPTYMALATVTILGGEYLRYGRVNLSWLGRSLGLALALVSFSVILWLPYHLRLADPLAGLALSPAQTPLRQYLLIHGLFIFLVVSLLLMQGWECARGTLGELLRRWQLGEKSPRLWLVPGLVLLPLTLLMTFLATGYATVALLSVLLSLLLWLAWLRLVAAPREPSGATEVTYTLFPLLLLGFALAIGIGVEFVAVGRDIERMNTVFKLYLEGWVLLALVGAYALWHVGFVEGLFRRWRSWSGVWGMALALLILAAGVYPVLGTRARLAQRFESLPLTLDGGAFMANAVYQDANGPIELTYDREAIRWLQEQVQGSPVILEAVTPEYRWGGRVSIYTGLPTVLGWRWHQTQQRCGAILCEAIDSRMRDVSQIYSTADEEEAMRLLRKYGVSYVYLGQTERLYYSVGGLTKFPAMAQTGQLTVAYQNSDVTIYHVTGAAPALF